MKKIVITGGHHSSALPVIKELQKRYPEIKIHWIGHKHSMRGNKNPTLEYREITEMGIPFYKLVSGKFYKTLNPIRLLKIPLGFIQSFFLLKKIKPEVIVSFGGYLAVPVVIVGKLLGIKAVTHEQTVVVGYANKLISNFADKILVSWRQSTKYFKDKDVVFTGIPLRQEIFEVRSDSLVLNEELPTLYITAGKTGSRDINNLILEGLGNLLQEYNIIHQTGDHSKYKHYALLTKKYTELGASVKGKYIPMKFVYSDKIGEVFSKADLVLSRSGAHICVELMALNKPALLIPISWVSHNEQFENASVLKDAGLAEILEEKDLSLDSLKSTLSSVFENLGTYSCTSDNTVRNSAELIVDEIEKTFKKKD